MLHLTSQIIIVIDDEPGVLSDKFHMNFELECCVNLLKIKVCLIEELCCVLFTKVKIYWITEFDNHLLQKRKLAV